MSKFIKLTAGNGDQVIVNPDAIQCIYPTTGSGDGVSTKLFLRAENIGPVYVKETVDEIYGMLTGSVVSAHDTTRRYGKYGRLHQSNVEIQDGCTPVVDLKPKTANVTSCHSSSITNPVHSEMIVVQGGNATNAQYVSVGSCVNEDLTVPLTVPKYCMQGAVMSSGSVEVDKTEE